MFHRASNPWPPPAAGAGPAASLVVRGARKAYPVGPAAHPQRLVVLRDVTLYVDEGECVVVHGGGVGPLTLLRCAAGLVRPDAGTVVWRDRSGDRAPGPAIALVAADWRPPAACFTARDVLEAAVPAGTGQAEADRLVEHAARGCGATALLGRRVAALPSLHRWRVGLAGAVAAGAAWLLLELPAPVPEERDADGRAAGQAAWLAFLALHARRHTLLVSAPPGRGHLVPASRALQWRAGRAWLGAAEGRALPGAGRRVAEPTGAGRCR